MKKIKLIELEKHQLTHQAMNTIHGGASCACSCYYAESGGSSIDANGNANAALGGVASEKGRYRVLIYENGRRVYM